MLVLAMYQKHQTPLSQKWDLLYRFILYSYCQSVKILSQLESGNKYAVSNTTTEIRAFSLSFQTGEELLSSAPNRGRSCECLREYSVECRFERRSRHFLEGLRRCHLRSQGEVFHFPGIFTLTYIERISLPTLFYLLLMITKWVCFLFHPLCLSLSR